MINEDKKDFETQPPIEKEKLFQNIEAVGIEESSFMPPDLDLNKEAQEIIERIVAEKDTKKAQELTQLFNDNQNKKTMIRVNKLSDLLDTITDQALVRFTARPDEISNKELFDGLKTVQDLIERGQKQVSGVGGAPLIQVNQQTNEVNIGGDNAASNLNRDSRERVKSAVLDILKNINNAVTTEVNSEAIEIMPEAIIDKEIAQDE